MDSKNFKKLLEEIPVPYSLLFLARVTIKIIENLSSKFLAILGEEESKFRELKDDSRFRVKFELSIYMLFIIDVFSSKLQTPEARFGIIYEVGNEILESLQEISPSYQESVFYKELDKRISQYSKIFRQSDYMLKLPLEIEIHNLLQEHLANAIVKGGFKRKKLASKELKELFIGSKKAKKVILDRQAKREYPMDVVSLAYGLTCQQTELNFRLLINDLFSANKDIRGLSEEDTLLFSLKHLP